MAYRVPENQHPKKKKKDAKRIIRIILILVNTEKPERDFIKEKKKRETRERETETESVPLLGIQSPNNLDWT